MKIINTTVTELALADGKTDAIHFDDSLPGFGLRLRRSGDKVLRSWIAQYKRAGQTRRVLLGSADLISAGKARAAAKQVLAKVAQGEDPQQQRVERREKDRLTLRNVVEQFLADKQETVRRRTLGELTRYLTGPHFKPLHGMPVDTITRKDIAARLVVIKREHGTTTAQRARTALSSMYTWAMRQGLVEHNPTINAGDLPTSKPRERVLADQELAAIWDACDRPFGYDKIVRLLILLGCRRQEVGSMVWSEIKDGTWRIPASRSKNGEAHELPLLPMAMAASGRARAAIRYTWHRLRWLVEMQGRFGQALWRARLALARHSSDRRQPPGQAAGRASACDRGRVGPSRRLPRHDRRPRLHPESLRARST